MKRENFTDDFRNLVLTDMQKPVQINPHGLPENIEIELRRATNPLNPMSLGHELLNSRIFRSLVGRNVGVDVFKFVISVFDDVH